MKLYHLHTKTALNTSLHEAWDFFVSPHNLSKITPVKMGFKVITPALPEKIYSGLLIEYMVNPVMNIPLKWVTEIKEVQPKKFFVDEQLKGPYSYWRHEHSFTEIEQNKVLMEDKVTYSLPLGWLGRVVALSMVQNKLASIFQFRYEAIKNIFPGSLNLT